MAAKSLPSNFIADLCALDLGTENRLVWERCIEIARECLAGDVGRAVPELELETWNLFSNFDGADPERLRPVGMPAFSVAARALALADLAARDPS